MTTLDYMKIKDLNQQVLDATEKARQLAELLSDTWQDTLLTSNDPLDRKVQFDVFMLQHDLNNVSRRSLNLNNKLADELQKRASEK